MKFLDEAKIYIQSGAGGNGCISFRREKFIEFGGPNGGDGGHGGDVIAQCVDGLNTLIDYRFQQHSKARPGGGGMGKDRHGANGADCILKVPIGLPNAGKSTFLAAVSAAKPKIADYPFPTLHPRLGVVRADNREFVIADLPGLIEGAHEGVGLGDKFLGHTERCRVLLHLVDGTGEDAGEAYKTVRNELEAYGHGLTEKPEVVALSKADALTPEMLKAQLTKLKRAAKQ